MEKRKVTVSIGGKPCTFYSDDSEEYISALEKRANEVMKQTAKFAGSSTCTNAILSVLCLTDQLLRTERAEKLGKTERPQRAEQKVGKKNNPKAAAEDKGQVSVWDLMDDSMY